MEEVEEVRKKREGKENRFGRRYGFEIKLRCVKLHLEEGLPFSLLSKEVGASTDGIRRWVKAYQERGEAGLRNAFRSSERRRRLPGPVREPFVSKENPPTGVRDRVKPPRGSCILILWRPIIPALKKAHPDRNITDSQKDSSFSDILTDSGVACGQQILSFYYPPAK